MRHSHARMRICSPGRDQHLHGKEFRKNKVLARGTKRFPRLRKMDRTDRLAAIAVFQILRQQWLNGRRVELLKKAINDAAQRALRESFGRRVDWCDPPKMDRPLLVVLDHFELRMIHANARPAQSRLAVDDKLLAGRDHFLHVMQIEPATDQRLTERVCVWFLQRRFENFFPTAETAQRCFNNFAGQTNRHVAFIAREFRKLMSIFMPAREMGQQMFGRGNVKSPQRQNFRARNPIQFFKRLRNFH